MCTQLKLAKMTFFIKVCLILHLVTSVSCFEEIYFVVSARNLDGSNLDYDGYADPFVKVWLGKEPSIYGKVQKSTHFRIGTSEFLSNDNSPKWNKVFKVTHAPGTGQVLYFEVRDHDPWNFDDTAGDVHVKLDDVAASRDSVAKPMRNSRLGTNSNSNQAILIVTRTTPIYFDLTLKEIPAIDTVAGMDANSSWLQEMELQRLPVLFADPYVNCYFREGRNGQDFLFSRTEMAINAERAVTIKKIPFENYQRGKNHFFHFVVKDHDSLTDDDDLGEVITDVDSFVGGNKPVTLTLQDNATLTISMSRTQ